MSYQLNVLAHVEERKGCFKPVQSASPPTLQSSPTYTSQELPMDLSLQNEGSSTSFFGIPCMPSHLFHSFHVVMKDYVPALTTSKEDIMDKVHLLGRGHQVFICYLPDPGSPYGSPDPKRSASNERAVTLLHYDLIRHGFAVFSDLSLGDQHPLNLLQWYISHIERCHHVILVCSAAFKELFTTLRPSGEVKDPRACRFLSYSPAIYAELERTMNRRKFLPVLLEPEWANSVPCVFQASFVYELYEMDQRTFDYNNKERHFEKLVCQMVGINRVELDAPKPEAPVIISHSSSSSGE